MADSDNDEIELTDVPPHNTLSDFSPNGAHPQPAVVVSPPDPPKPSASARMTVQVPMSAIDPNALGMTRKEAQLPLMPRQPARRVEMSARETIGKLMEDVPEAGDYYFRVNRYLPTRLADGTEVKHGYLLDIGFMPYDCMVQQVEERCGGGRYRITVVDKDKKIVTGLKVILVDVDMRNFKTITHPDQPQEARVEEKPYYEEGDDEAQRSKSQIKNEMLKEQALQAEIRRIKRESEAEEQALRLRQLRDQSNGGSGNAQIAMLSRSIEQMQTFQAESLRLARESQEKQLEMIRLQQADDRRIQSENLARLTETIARVAERPAPVQDSTTKDLLLAIVNKPTPVLPPPPPDNTAKEIMASQNDLLGKLLPVLVQQKPQDTGAAVALESMKAMNELTLKMAAKDNTALVNALTSRGDSAKDLEMCMKFLKMGEDRMTKSLELAQNLNGGGDDDGVAAALAAGAGGGGGDGFMSVIKDVLVSAASNPKIAEALVGLLGNKNQPAEQAAALHQLQMARQQQLPFMQPQALPMPPSIEPHNRQVQLSGPPPVYPPLPVAPMVQRPIQAAPAGMAQQMSAQPQQVQLAPIQTPPVAPLAQAEQSELMTEEVEVEPTSEERLRISVTEVMKNCANDIVDKKVKRDWPDEAFDYWHEDFKRALAAAADDKIRVNMIGAQCEASVMTGLRDLLLQPGDNGVELARFYQGLHELVEKINNSMNPPPAQPVNPIAPVGPVSSAGIGRQGGSDQVQPVAGPTDNDPALTAV